MFRTTWRGRERFEDKTPKQCKHLKATSNDCVEAFLRTSEPYKSAHRLRWNLCTGFTEVCDCTAIRFDSQLLAVTDFFKMQVCKAFFGQRIGNLWRYFPRIKSTNSMKSHVFMQLLGHSDNFYQWLTIINTDVFRKEGKVVNLFFKRSLDFYYSSFWF